MTSDYKIYGTVSLKHTTREKLNRFKAREGCKNIDEVINVLLANWGIEEMIE